MLISEFHKFYKSDGLSIEVAHHFQSMIYAYFRQHGRKFPFRQNITPYNVLISEIMLQQTQTGQVSEKFLNFIDKFPNFLALSEAPLESVLKAWQGLGYNRRAVALKKIAEIIIEDHNAKLPDSVEILKTFPQIGHNTASSIVAFAFNKPTIFIETNIRRVYIYFFFPGKSKITDKEITPILEKTIDNSNPRKWYYALMDYGVMLKKTYPELNKRSAHYRKQSPFKGSNRQIRGKILKILLEKRRLKIVDLKVNLKDVSDKRLLTILNQLEKEDFICLEQNIVKLRNQGGN
ncbi:MAG: A/G-specific adenine glycosylase [Promethearchaeota archaeon]